MDTAEAFVSYDYFKTKLLRHPLPIFHYQLRDNILLHFIASLLAGTVATSSSVLNFACRLPDLFAAICSPADVLKSRLMSSVSVLTRMSKFISVHSLSKRRPTPALFIYLHGRCEKKALCFFLRDGLPHFPAWGPIPSYYSFFMRQVPHPSLARA